VAKLKSIPFKFTSQSGEVLSFSAEVSVLDSSGEFSVTIPDELETAAKQISNSHGSVYGVKIDRPRSYLKVCGPTLEGCKAFIAHAAEDHLHCEITSEIVIVYGVSNKVAYVKDSDGGFYNNGYEAGDRYRPGDGAWLGTLNGCGSSSNFYQVGLAARAIKKTTYARSSGVKTVYERVESSEIPSGSWLERLNGFVGLHIPFNKVGSLQQLPYSEDAAMFFYGVLMSMCQLADRIDGFIGDSKTVRAAIENQSAGHLLLKAV
jgi:hypothetical protein